MSRWRRRARRAVLLLVVLSFVWGGVRLADPLANTSERRTVDASEPPAEIAYDAMMQTEDGNYAYVLWFGNETERERVAQVRVDTADRQFKVVEPADDGQRGVTYGDEGGTWHRNTVDGRWFATVVRSAGHGVFRKEGAVLDDADVSVVARNNSTVVVRVNDTAAAMLLDGDNISADREPRASLTLVVDRERGVLVRSVYRYSFLDGTDENATRQVSVVTREYRRWGAVDVERPVGLPYGFISTLNDLTDTCPGCEEGDG